MEQIRLNKYLAQCGVCSRRDADKLIEQGTVLVNGSVARVGQTVAETDEIQVHKRVISARQQRIVLAYNKPIGVTCTEKDKYAEKIVTEMVHCKERVTYAGRLDKDSEGLLLLTNDGDLIQAMMKGSNKHEKEYVVKVDKKITPDFLIGLEQGVYLKDLDVKTRPCKTEGIGPYTFKIVITQGLNRQIRRMCGAYGYTVKGLKRIRVMNVCLGDIKLGDYRRLQEHELERLYGDCGLEYI